MNNNDTKLSDNEIADLREKFDMVSQSLHFSYRVCPGHGLPFYLFLVLAFSTRF